MISVIIPVNALVESKTRLANVLSVEQRIELTSTLLLRLLDICQQVKLVNEILIVTPDTIVQSLIGHLNVDVHIEAEPWGLNNALSQAGSLASKDSSAVLILPSDLPFISVDDIVNLLNPLHLHNSKYLSSEPEQNPGLMIICPDQHRSGTNALLLSDPEHFSFQFGDNSFDKHIGEANLRGLTIIQIENEGIMFDLDTETDLREYRTRAAGVYRSSS